MTQPYTIEVGLDLPKNDERKDFIIEFNVANCWQFQDKTKNGYFGWDDIIDGAGWCMNFPEVTVKLE